MEVAEVIGAYGEAWTEPDPARRAELLERAWADDGVYCDPTTTVSGRAAMERHIAGFGARLPGCTIVVTSAIDAHDGYARFGWEIRDGSGAAVGEGTDFAVLGPDGRIQRIVGFFGPLPPAPAG